MALKDIECMYHSPIMANRMSEMLNKEYYTFECRGRDVTVSRGIVIRLCQEGHIFRMLLLGGSGFRNENNMNNEKISLLKNYNIHSRVFSVLILALRINEPKLVYKYKLILESIGGFKFIDKYVKKRNSICNQSNQTEPQPPTENNMQSFNRVVIDLISDDEETVV